MKKLFRSRKNISLFGRTATWLTMSLMVVSSLIMTLPLLANAGTADSQFCSDNGQGHTSACEHILGLIGPSHLSSTELTLLDDKTFMGKLQAYEQSFSSNLQATATSVAHEAIVNPKFDAGIFRHGYQVVPIVTPTGGPGNCAPSNKPITLTKSSDTVNFFDATVNTSAYTFSIGQGCSYQASWNLFPSTQLTGCAYATAYLKDKMNAPILYQVGSAPSDDSFTLDGGLTLYSSLLDSTTKQITAKFDSTQAKTVSIAPFYMECGHLRTAISPMDGSTLTLGNATLVFTVLKKNSDPDGWCTATQIANTYNCVLDWGNDAHVFNDETTPQHPGQAPYCQPSWLTHHTGKGSVRAQNGYWYTCGFPSKNV